MTVTASGKVRSAIMLPTVRPIAQPAKIH